MKRMLRVFAIGVLSFAIAGCKLFDFKLQNGNENGVVNGEENNNPSNPEGEDNPNPNPEQGDENQGNESQGICDVDPNICNVRASQQDMAYDATDEEIVTVYESAVKSVVTVFSYNDSYKQMASGSGVIISETSDHQFVYIYTNAHVTNAKQTARVDGIPTTVHASVFEIVYYNNIRVSAILVGYSGPEDVSILKAKIEPNGDFKVATAGDSSRLKVGQTVLAIGSPLGLEYSNTLTKGIISGLNVEISADNDEDGVDTEMYLIQTDAALSSGNSGGPLFSADGKFIGINTLKINSSSSNSVESFNFAIPGNHFMTVANRIMTTGSYSRPKVGVSVLDIGSTSLNYRETNGITVPLGILITTETGEGSAVSTTGASYGKLFDKEVITKINDVTIVNRSSFVVELLRHLSGDTITLTVCSADGSNVHEVSITLG